MTSPCRAGDERRWRTSTAIPSARRAGGNGALDPIAGDAGGVKVAESIGSASTLGVGVLNLPSRFGTNSPVVAERQFLPANVAIA